MAKKKRITKKVLFAKTIEILQPWLKLEDWRIVVKYSRSMKSSADCETWPEYKQAIIRLNLNTLKSYNDYEIISTAIHELCHCLTWNLATWAEQLCKKDAQKLEHTRMLDESLVTNLEKILATLACDIVQERLAEEGYGNLDLVFESFHTRNETLEESNIRSKKTRV
jgi:hypothetical protein